MSIRFFSLGTARDCEILTRLSKLLQLAAIDGSIVHITDTDSFLLLGLPSIPSIQINEGAFVAINRRDPIDGRLVQL